MSTQHGHSMTLNLKVWRQNGPNNDGKLVDYKLDGVSPDMSFLEMIDLLNQNLIKQGENPVAFDHDCREGICGSCAMVINGDAHGPETGTATCQLHMRTFRSGDTVVVEPFRAKAFPVIKDLSVDRSALDRIQVAGGYISVNTGSAPEANSIPISKETVDLAMDAAACIQCGACVAACPNGSAMLFVSAKVSQLALLPQGQVESTTRARRMIWQMDEEDFGSCTNIGACSTACPKEIKLEHIARTNREYAKAMIKGRK